MASTSKGNGSDGSDAVSKLREMINEVDVCMLMTTDADGNVISRPMETCEIDEAGCAWFFTNEFSEKVHEISRDNHVSLIYSHPGKHTYVHVNGVSHIVQDREKTKALWRPEMKAWFPGGIDDPKLCLLKVQAREAFYWNSSTAAMVNFFRRIKAMAVGETYDDGEMGKLDIGKG